MIRGYYKGKNLYLCKAHGQWVSRTASIAAYPVIEKVGAGFVVEPKKFKTTFDL
jgi:hypothetical protein